MSIFFALKPPPRVAGQLAAIARDHASRCGGRATSADTVHLTLSFLGEFPLPRIGELIGLGSRIRASSFDLTIDRLGYWSHNHLLWAGSVAPPPALLALAGQLENALAEKNCRIDGARDGHPFAPHVTLVRKVAKSTAQVQPTQLAAADCIEWPCVSFVLVRSKRSEAATLHEIVQEFALDHPA